jgi:3-dehydroquinate dehydratase
MASLLLINGPNLSTCSAAGNQTSMAVPALARSSKTCAARPNALGHALACFQSNGEHSIIERIQKAAAEKVDFICSTRAHSALERSATSLHCSPHTPGLTTGAPAATG